jgi:hypothetical protein
VPDPPEPLNPGTHVGDPRLDDLAVYRRLLDLSAHTGALSQRCWSAAASTALRTSSTLLRRIASALYRTSLDK